MTIGSTCIYDFWGTYLIIPFDLTLLAEIIGVTMPKITIIIPKEHAQFNPNSIFFIFLLDG